MEISQLHSDEYGYLNRDEFSSERFKVKLQGLPKHYGIAEVKKLLRSKLKLSAVKVKRPFTGSPWMFACFECEDDRREAVQSLKGFRWKGKKLRAGIAKPSSDPLLRNFQNKGLMNSHSLIDCLRQATIPLYDMPYDQQLAKKFLALRKILKKYPTCQLNQIRPSSLLDGYRSKCVFSMGVHACTGEVAVGFRLGRYAKGEIRVGPPNLRHVPLPMVNVVDVFQQLIRHSNLPAFSPLSQCGVWKLLTVHMNDQGKLMLTAGIYETTDIAKVRSILLTGPDEGWENLNVCSVYIQEVNERIFHHVFGDPYLIENILHLKIILSPQSFFPTNTQTAHVLYNSVVELAKVDDWTTVIDMYCGIGSIGLILAKQCAQVFGIDVSTCAIADAKKNASINGIANCKFFAGKTEDLLQTVVLRSHEKKVVAIADPPRSGMHPKAIVQLRKCDKIRKLVYLSCNPLAAKKNFADLVRPISKRYGGSPFIPVNATPIDMFPHTEYCELIVLFEKICD